MNKSFGLRKRAALELGKSNYAACKSLDNTKSNGKRNAAKGSKKRRKGRNLYAKEVLNDVNSCVAIFGKVTKYQWYFPKVSKVYQGVQSAKYTGTGYEACDLTENRFKPPSSPTIIPSAETLKHSAISSSMSHFRKSLNLDDKQMKQLTKFASGSCTDRPVRPKSYWPLKWDSTRDSSRTSYIVPTSTFSGFSCSFRDGRRVLIRSKLPYR